MKLSLVLFLLVLNLVGCAKVEIPMTENLSKIEIQLINKEVEESSINKDIAWEATNERLIEIEFDFIDNFDYENLDSTDKNLVYSLFKETLEENKEYIFGTYFLKTSDPKYLQDNLDAAYNKAKSNIYNMIQLGKPDEVTSNNNVTEDSKEQVKPQDNKVEIIPEDVDLSKLDVNPFAVPQFMEDDYEILRGMDDYSSSAVDAHDYLEAYGFETEFGDEGAWDMIKDYGKWGITINAIADGEVEEIIMQPSLIGDNQTFKDVVDYFGSLPTDNGTYEVFTVNDPENDHIKVFYFFNEMPDSNDDIPEFVQYRWIKNR